MQTPLFGVAKIELAHGTGDADVAQAPFFFETRQIVDRALVWKQAVFHAAQEHHRELKPLGGVQRHHLYAVFPLAALGLARFQNRMRQKTLQRRQVFALGLIAARRTDQFSQILDACFAAIGFVLAVVFNEAAVIDHMIDLLIKRQAFNLAAQPLDQDQKSVQ